jgi:hypothetical protein
VAEHIAESYFRGHALLSIAAVEVKTGLMADAMTTFAEALQITQSPRRRGTAFWSLMTIAAGLPE